jgi:hypothetical protein
MVHSRKPRYPASAWSFMVASIDLNLSLELSDGYPSAKRHTATTRNSNSVVAIVNLLNARFLVS